MVATTHRRRGGVYVKSVAPGSPAAQCGIEPGDKIHSINGQVIPDSLSFSFNIASLNLLMVVEKVGREHWELEIENDPDIPFGLQLEDDAIMLCRNKCIFCFVDQNPKSYRKSLLIKDEDIRLSFLYGNYSTLSSTDAAEEERIIRERITPLYVSVHATDPETRVFMLKNKKTGNILERLTHLARNGIAFHAQIVLCPGINDGAILERTLRDLTDLHPACLSVAVVPLGITEHRQGLPNLRGVTASYCRETIAFCKPFRETFKQRFGNPMVYLGDEFYIRSGEPIPSRVEYYDFPQMENGIGMVRRFLDDFDEYLPAQNISSHCFGTLVTGALFAPILSACVTRLNRVTGARLQVAAIRNTAFGADFINVAGLVHGNDIIAQLEGRENGEFILVPHAMLKDPEDPVMIDDVYPHQVGIALNVPVVTGGNTPGELFQALADWPAHIFKKTPACTI